MDADDVLDLALELGQLKHLPRTGWFRAGVPDPESVAEHNLRAAQIAYLLARLEDHPDPERVCTMVVFHEIGEARVGDLDNVMNRYVDAREEEAVEDQLAPLGPVGEDLLGMWREHEDQATDAGAIARDADLLEAALTARELEVRGHDPARAWIEGTEADLATDAARRLLEALDDADPARWWRGDDASNG